MSHEADPSRQTLESVFSGELSPVGLESPGHRIARIGERFASHPLPQRIGRYHVIARIGVGGMGEVFSARDPDLDRELAIKLVHAELDDGSASSIRLLREAQTLAHVDHPNVVKIYEVGLYGTRVFLAMEVIRGASLRDHVRLGRPWRELVGVLAQAGRGLHAVHQAGLVHRDIKPDNVLVGDDGRVRVVDFGLARSSGLATDPTPGDGAACSLPSPSVPLPSRLTASGAVVGTPVYMAPEQLRSPVIDARCDQFGFCVMAWEALAGTRPFPGGSISELFEGHRRGVEIPRGSAVPTGIWRALQRGTAVDPERRWASMLELVHELERVASRRPWVGPATLAAAATASVLGLAWSVGTAAPQPCDDAAAVARSERIEALIGSRIGSASADGQGAYALGGLYEHADALAQAREQACVARAQHGASTTSDLESACLDRSSHRLDALVSALGDEHGSTGAAETLRAIATLPDPQRCAVVVADGYEPPPSGELAFRVERVRAELDDAWTALALGHAREIAGRVDGLTAMADASGYLPLRAEVMWFEGELARQLGDPARARVRLLDAAALAEASRHDELGADVWAALTELAISELGDAEIARQWLRRAEVATARLAPDPLRTRVLRLRRAQLARLTGDLDDASVQLDRLLAEAPAERELDPSWWWVLASAADVAEATGAPDRALALHERHRDSMAARLGSEHHELATAYYNLGKTALGRRDFARARAELEHAERIWSRVRGDQHLDLALVHAAAMQLETDAGDLPRAREHAEQVLRIRAATLPGDHPDLALAWVGVGGTALLQGDVEGAVSAYDKALAIEELALGADHPETALVRANAAEAALAAGQHRRARSLAEQASTRLAQVEALDPELLAFAERVRGAALREAGETEEAERALLNAEALLGPTADPHELGVVLIERARVQLAVGDAARARTLLDRAQSQLAALEGESATRLRDQAVLLARRL